MQVSEISHINPYVGKESFRSFREPAQVCADSRVGGSIGNINTAFIFVEI